MQKCYDLKEVADEIDKSIDSPINSASKNFAFTLVLVITSCWPLS